jgi:hypothetical protein
MKTTFVNTKKVVLAHCFFVSSSDDHYIPHHR